MSGTQFALTKWYMDCVSDTGDAAIVYAARLRWGILRLGYCAVMLRIDGELKESDTFRGCEMPRVEGDKLEWGSGRVGVRGEWERIDPAYEAVLWKGDGGEVAWRCEMPRARARIAMRDGTELRGLAYVERLDMTVRPWRLPIEEVRWGRVLTESDGMVWIEWRGPEPRVVVLRNGRSVAGLSVSDSEVEWEGGRVGLTRGAALRSGALGETVLRAPLRWIVPKRVREMAETKWISRATIEALGVASEGWAVHELVQLGRGSGGGG